MVGSCRYEIKLSINGSREEDQCAIPENPLNSPAILSATVADCYWRFRNLVMPCSIHFYAAPCQLYIGANEEIQKPFIGSVRFFGGHDFCHCEGPFVDRPQPRARGRGDYGGG